MNQWLNKTALVTGASSGIGSSIASTLVKHGLTVYGCGRGVEKIESLSKSLSNEPGRLIAIKCDLRDRNQIDAMFERIEDECGGVDICVNNAGLSNSAPLLSGDPEKWQEMIDVNIMALCLCTQKTYQLMKKRGCQQGHIILISSMSGHRVVNSSSSHFYCATKFAVKGLLEGLRNELRNEKSQIRVSCISPGIVETEFVERKDGPEAASKLYKSLKALQAQDIADAVIYTLSSPPHVQVHDILIRPTEQVK